MNYGTSCVEPSDPWIGRCQYYAAYEVLQHIYGDIKVTIIILQAKRILQGMQRYQEFLLRNANER